MCDDSIQACGEDCRAVAGWVSLVGGVVLSVLVARMIQDRYWVKYFRDVNRPVLEEFEVFISGYEASYSIVGHNRVEWWNFDMFRGESQVKLIFIDIDLVQDPLYSIANTVETVALPGFIRVPARLIARDVELRRDAGFDPNEVSGTVVSAGLPMRCVQHWYYSIWESNVPGKMFPDYMSSGSFSIRKPSVFYNTGLSYSPIWSGLLFNTFFYGLPVYGLLSIPACISGLRRRFTNRCHACGYSLDGLTVGSCPECNLTIKQRRLKETVNELS